ncbi:serine/threonine-protein phosphatase 2A regulatory subunit B'' subunit alpha isoform X1 [Pantherophis guttatus]|uniref:Serine/threonine-protein phosphatase 2A regulatory subunit B'' subunit alpha isoform X1 n=1 Tax=Pantherophis guttatus TaxID=94885 RepID=A0A6P9DWW7_PANGU|nr:serine/threonine-protein phosphatase 2A regulatory subunit B'' subunit alpha isoform X1 [Pantherophis guttatus]XP_034295563.1 serine/threonine-protein phosphatase 2A regulatory subunit B'' subunit alpha isoform X1 [Pantherophis guttatus]XP_034295564.1 serine/threonine-protein phosphatase 2A regulatory subunit B'' subunit alpha isoform X1 [Pantherophis guttatus]XP_034295565.1 serine/threonine-protein phosphatase 2A regulatory subunit B'' subunit alpha isoform X1 [Pantherophis guttatus]XP_0342
MAANYKRVITTVNCYSSAIIDNQLQNVVHYCTGTCQVFKQGIMCIVAHHSVCPKLLKVSTPNFRNSDLTHRFSMPENSIALPGDEDYNQLLPSNPKLKKGSSVQSSANLKDITEEAINLASGKIKEFSFEKLRNSSNQANYRKGRKVKSDQFNRRSLDFDLISGHFSSDEILSPPNGVLNNCSHEEKWHVSSPSVKESGSSVVPLPIETFPDGNFITQILEKHKLDGSSSGDIKMCLDILLKCSEDLKKCTDIIKQCIKKKSSGNANSGNNSESLANSEIIYMNLMTRFSSYLKQLPFEFRHPGDMVELINSLSALEQSHFSPIFGNEQPPRYEDVVTSASSVAKQAFPSNLKRIQDNNNTNSSTNLIQIPSVDISSNALQNNIDSRNDCHVLPQLQFLNPSNSVFSTESLYIVEESDGEKVRGSASNVQSRTIRGDSESSQERAEWLNPSLELSKTSHTVAQPLSKGDLSISADSIDQAFNYNGQVSKEELRKNNQEEIDKLLLDLENFSQKMEITLRETTVEQSDSRYLKSSGLTSEDKGKDCFPEDKSVPSSLSKLVEINGHKMDEDDKTLLLRILESIEDFAQELVEFQLGKGSLSKEKEVMHILQETLATPSITVDKQSCIDTLKKKPASPLIQQMPEVIKVQNKQEKKPVTQSLTPANSTITPQSLLSTNKETLGAPLSINIPTFYFPYGLPNICNNQDEIIIKVEAAFSEFEDKKVPYNEMGKIIKICGCPLYWKAPMFNASGGEQTGFVSVHSFVAMWRKILHNCHDDASKFICLLAKHNCNYLEQEDFIPILQDIVETHPGLTFLKDAPEFHSRYITTVIQRIFYIVNRSWSGKISLIELRKSNFLQTLALLEEEEDINQITDYFSYEHFYVIYCKFWELDTDHDLYINQSDLARYNDQALSSRIIERIFTGAVLRGSQEQKENQMSYADFVWFLISEEDKRCLTSIEYWFRCMDLDGDGTLSMYELEYFYEEQCERMESMGIEPLPFHDLLCQMLDLVKPEYEGRITLRDLKRCRMAHVFYNTFFNLEKYLDNEQRDPFAVQKDIENESPEPSDWDRYAAEEYEILVAEESGSVQLQEGSFEDDYETDELLSMSEIEEKSDNLVISHLSA